MNHIYLNLLSVAYILMLYGKKSAKQTLDTQFNMHKNRIK
ncbi:MAG: hypothetical protein ACI8QY_000685, partial [bacterium]